MISIVLVFFFFSSRRRHTRWTGDWSSDVCSSDLDRCRPAIACTMYRRLLVGTCPICAAPAALVSSSGWMNTCSTRSEERRVGKSVDLGGGRIIKKKKGGGGGEVGKEEEEEEGSRA